jgi:hypothetical protein
MTVPNDNRSLPPPEWLDGPADADASSETHAVYEQIAARLRVPFLGPFWRALTWDQPVFGGIWHTLGPLLSTGEFERGAAALRRAALIEPAVEMSSHQAFKGDLVRVEIDYEMRRRIANYNAVVHYALGKTLLAANWLDLNLSGRAASSGRLVETIAPGIAAGAVAVPPLAPHEVRGRAAELLAEIPRAHGHPIADEYFRALARLPDYLNAAWNAIKPLVRDEAYDERGRALVEQALRTAGGLPAAVVLPDLTPPQSRRLTAVTAYFARRHLPDLLIDAALIKGLTDGPDLAQVSPYDVT